MERLPFTTVTASSWSCAQHTCGGDPTVTLHSCRIVDGINEWGGEGILEHHPVHHGLTFPNGMAAQLYAMKVGLIREYRHHPETFAVRAEARRVNAERAGR